MSNLHLCVFLASAAIAAGCATGRIEESTWLQDPPPRPGDPAYDARTTQAPPPRTPPPRPRTIAEERRLVPWEVTLGGSGTNDETFDVGHGQASGSVGYYFNEWIELVLRQGVSYSDDEGVPGTDGDDVWDFQTRVALDLHLPLGMVVPYIGVNVGYLYGDTEVASDTGAAGPEAGVKIYLQSDAFLQVGAEWEFFFDRQDARNQTFEETFDDGQIFYFAGFGLRL
jgi:hypothetical protein